jgi:Uma2 family endonuclease
MTPDERRRAVEALPTWVSPEESGAMDGDQHNRICRSVRSALEMYYEATGQTVYVSGEIAVYFPGAFKAAPDVFVVPGAQPGPRHSWVVSNEGLSPAWVLEVHVLGHRLKDLQRRVVEYAQCGVREYFVFDYAKRRLWGYRLADPAIALYTRIVPQSGRYRSEVLGLSLALEGDRIRLYHGTARLLDAEEHTEQLREQLNDEICLRQEAEEKAMLEAKARAEAEEKAMLEAKARAEAEEKAMLEAKARAEAEEKAMLEAKARAAVEHELARLRALLAERSQG